MSRIYDALKNAQELRSKNRLAAGDGLGLMDMPELRGSPRRDLDVDLTVYGHAAGEKPFHDRARAVRGNANGGLLLLDVPVIEGQDLFLINNQTSQEQICRVVNVRVRNVHSSEVSVVFSSPNDEFWHLSSIPSDLNAEPSVKEQ